MIVETVDAGMGTGEMAAGSTPAMPDDLEDFADRAELASAYFASAARRSGEDDDMICWGWRQRGFSKSVG